HDGHTMAVRRAVFSPDGRLLVSVGEDNRVIVWDFARRQRLATFNDHTDRVTTVEFSPDGKWFVTAGADGNIIIWDANRLEKTAVLPGQRGVVRAIAFSADGKMLVTPTNDDMKNIWEVGSWKKLREVNTRHYRYGQFLLSPDGRWMMTPHGDVCGLLKEQCVLDLRPLFWSGITPYAKKLRPPFWTSAALSPDGRRMISIDAGGFVAFSTISGFEAPDERKLTGNYRMHSDSGRAVAYSPDGKLAASGAEDIVLWDAMGQKKLARFKHQANVSSLAFSPDGRWLVSTHRDGAILAWDTIERELMADFTGHSAAVEAVAFAPDGKLIASASEDGSVIVWDVEQGGKQTVLLWHATRVTAVSFSADGKWLASNDLDGNLAMWDVAGRRLRWSQKIAKRIPSEASYCAAISPDGRWLATSYGVYESESGNLVNDFRTETVPFSLVGLPQPTEVRDVAFSADGRWLVSITARGEIAVRQVGQWQVVESLKLNGAHLVSLSLSANGKQMVTGEDEGLIRLWQTQPLRQAAALEALSGRIMSVAFSPDGKQFVLTGDDKMIALWDVNSRKLITKIGLHAAPVYAVAFSPDGKQLISGGHDHSVRLYTRHRSLWGWPLK
ncbi:MAG: WD40 repeat domain-containing protein, partial [Blastocatellia bacterium]